MSYQVQITKRTDNPGPLSVSQSYIGVTDSLPVIDKVFFIVTENSFFHTSLVKNIRYQGSTIILQTMNSIYEVVILDNDVQK